MASGIGSGLSIGPEDTGYANVADVAVVKVPFTEESLELDQPWYDSDSLVADNLLPTSDSRRLGSRMGGGSTEMKVPDIGIEWFFDAAFGGYEFTVGTPNEHRYAPAALRSYVLQVQEGATPLAGNPVIKQHRGAVCSGFEFSLALDEKAEWSQDWITSDEELVNDGSITFDGVAVTGYAHYVAHEATISVAGSTSRCVTAVTLTGDNTQAARKCLGAVALNKQPERDGKIAITGTATIDFDPADLVLYDAWRNGDDVAMVWTLDAEGSTNELEITMNVHLEGSTPTIDGPGVIEVEVPFVVVAATDGDDKTGFDMVLKSPTASLHASTLP